MKQNPPSLRRNFVVASVAHLALVGFVAFWSGVVAPWRDRSAVEVELFVPADLLGDMPVGEGTGRGAYTPPKLGSPAEASFAPPSEATLTPEEQVVPKRSTPAPEPGEIAVPKKEVKKAAPKKVEKTEKVVASASSGTSPSKSKSPSASGKTGTKGSPTGSPSGVSESDIRNRFAKALRAEAGGTPYGDGRKAGGGEGKSSVIGSRDGSPDEIGRAHV